MPMWIIRRSDMPSSVGFWRHMAITGGDHFTAGLEGLKRVLPFLGKPRLGFLVSAGNMDSMVNHYSVSRKSTGRQMLTHRAV